MYDLSALDAESAVARVVALRKEIDAMRPLDRDQVGKAMQRLRLEWTYHSNAIEGNSLTYGETRALLLHGVTAQGKPLKDHLDIKGHREALGYLERFVQAKEPLTLVAVRELHRILLGEPYETRAETPDGQLTTRTVMPGEFKTQPNHVVTATGETHYYARPEETPALMQDLVDWARDTWPQIAESPEAAVPFAADLHHRFTATHPFDDGNGRMARLLMNLVLMRAGYPPAVLRQENRPAYYGALAQADGGDLGPLVRFVAEELAETMDLYLCTLRGEPDPDAFSRRVALLKRQVDTSVQTETRKEEALLELSVHYVVPLLERIQNGVDELASLFDEVSGYGAYFGPNGRVGLSPDDLIDAIAKNEWHRFEWNYSLKGFRLSPLENAPMAVRGYAGDEYLVLSGGWMKPEEGIARLQYGTPISEAQALERADEILNRLVRGVERLRQQASGE